MSVSEPLAVDRSATRSLPRLRPFAPGARDEKAGTLRWELLIDPSRRVVDGFRRFETGSGNRVSVGDRQLLPGEIAGCTRALAHPGQCGTLPECVVCPINLAARRALHGEPTITEGVLDLGDGHQVDIEVWSEPIDHEGSIDGASIVVEEVTDRNRRRVLERAFLHDTLNTASGIHGLLDLVRSDLDAADANDLLNLAFSRVEDLIDEIRGYRLLGDAEVGSLRAHLAPIKPATVLGALAARHRRPLADVGIRLEMPRLVPDLEILSDAVLLRRVLDNLIRNAAEASRTGESIRISFHAENDEAIFRVTNPAVMTPLVRLQVFRRSFSTKGPGRGIGTFSVKLLTESYLRGHVAFTSAVGEGTTFEVRLPRLRPPA